MKYLILLTILTLTACAGAGPLPESRTGNNETHQLWSADGSDKGTAP